MTSITAENLNHRPASRTARRSVASFVAGVVLTAAAAIGINAAVGGSSTTVQHGIGPEPGCFVLDGAC